MTVPVRLSEARQKATEAQKQIVEAQKVMADSVKEALTEGMSDIFARYPFLGSVQWTQYTPYFNDGDPCVFCAHFYPGINSVKDIEDGTNSRWSEENGEDWYANANEKNYAGYDSTTRTSQYKPNEGYNPEYGACEKEVEELFKTIQGDSKRAHYDTPSPFEFALLQAFGDHARVTITRSGIEVDVCDHD